MSLIMNDNGKGSEGSTSTSTVQWSQPCRQFEFGEILSATEYFDESLVIGAGGFGKVYKGSIVNGSTSVVVAIKRLDSMSNQGPSEFWAEVEMLSNLRHCHLVSLIGYCNHEKEKEMILVYEYMPNGTLEDHLHKLNTPLSWLERLKICIGAARGLDYLHTGTGIEFGVIHRDVKSSNILLSKSWAAKISDFGLSKLVQRDQQPTYVNTLVKGSFGYFDPTYFATGKLTTKSDVYAFGVVLLEVLCRKRAVDKSLDCGLATWALDSIKEGSLKHIIDSDIRDEISAKCLKGFVQVAERCLNYRPKHRPTMAEVVFTLESVFNIQQKTYNLLQTTGKTIFSRMADMFSSTKNSGMEFGFLISKERKLLMPREKILQQNGLLVYNDKLKANCLDSMQFFRAKELEKATNNYADNRVLGRGGYSTVYKGVLPDTRVVEIKRLRIMGQAQLERFIDDIVFLSQINHKNIVQLLGCCLETEDPSLVFEFISNGTLHYHMHNKSVRLSWDSRLRIAHGSAGALAYLHTMSIIHRDVNSANILLDENFTAKVSDFGASKLLPLDDEYDGPINQGTLAYWDPEYFGTCPLTDKSDVYSFGVVLVELLTGEEPFVNLAKYFVMTNRQKQLSKIIDPVVLEEATDEQLSAACELACRCLEESSVSRPSMTQVTMELESLRNRLS